MIKILLVDDEKGLCEYLRQFFSSRGYNVFIATTAQDAVSIVKKEKPELVLLDINLPDENGLEVLRRIKNISGQTRVIMVTVEDDPDTKEKARVLGADEFVRKPFSTDYLEDVVILKVGQITKDKEPAQILIVEDEDEPREYLNKFLKRRFECKLLEAASGEEALKILKNNKIDLVFLDIRMPGISGIDVIKQKKKLDYKPTIWVVTGFDSEEIAHKVIEEGADDYITKPFSLKVIDRKVRDFLSGIGKYKPKYIEDSE